MNHFTLSTAIIKFMRSLEGKVALITGAKGDLGTFVTEAFLAAGAKAQAAVDWLIDKAGPLPVAPADNDEAPSLG